MTEAQMRTALTGTTQQAAEILLGRRAWPKAPSFISWLVANGGLKDVGGDVASVIGEKRMRPGLINRQGREFDQMGALIQNIFPGAFPHRDVTGNGAPGRDEILGWIDGALRGCEPEWWLETLSPADKDLLDAAKLAGELEQMCTEAGVEPKNISDVARVLRGEPCHAPADLSDFAPWYLARKRQELAEAKAALASCPAAQLAKVKATIASLESVIEHQTRPRPALQERKTFEQEEFEREQRQAEHIGRVISQSIGRAMPGNGVDWDALDRGRRDGGQFHQERERTRQPPPQPPLPYVNMSTWDDAPVPEQDWAVLNRVPRQQVALFSGEGAAGKSTIQLHAAAAHVLGQDWLGTMPEPGPALFIDAEDDVGVIHRRLAAIVAHYKVKFADLIKGGLHLISLAGRDAVLATVSRSGKVEPTPLYSQILEAAGDIKPISIGIASSANVYAGSEIERNQVQQFISLLTRVAIVANGSATLLSHPSLAGIASDTGLSGNTQWHNAVRARFYLKGVKPEDGEQADNDLREIVFKKNNYGPISETIVLRYTDGLFLPVAGVNSLDRAAAEMKAEDIFLDLLRRYRKENRNVSSSASRNYAPALFAREEEATSAAISSRALEGAMRRLFKAGKIWNEPCGKPSRPAFRLALK